MSDPELERYRHEFEQASAQARAMVAGLDEARFNWRPGDGEWSIEECLSHLTMVGQWAALAMETAIEDARTRGIRGSGPFQYGPVDRTLIALAEPPARLRFSAPRRFVPLHGQPLTAIMPTFFHLQSQLALLLDRADGLDLARVKVPTPMPVLRVSLGATFAQIAAHERRHLMQAERVRERMPSAAAVSVLSA